MKLFPNALDLLETLRVRGIPMALITDLTTQIQLRKISYLGLESYFDAVITSEESGSEKPAAAPFELAKEHLGISISHAWFIGDNYEKDIVGAKLNLNAVTFQRVSVKDKSRLVEEFTDATFSDFQQIIDLVVRFS
jgi:putative hydrolase of the HAD superfamily